MKFTAVPALVSALLAAGPALAGAGPLTPHRAVYDLSLAGGAGLSEDAPDMTGRMVYEFTGNACEGYTTNFRFVVASTGDDGSRSVTDLRTSNHEDADGAGFQFLSQTYTNQVLTEDVKGTAASADGKVTVELGGGAKPVTFAGTTLFPTAHLLKVIEAAKGGASVVEQDVYDGSDGGGRAYRTTTLIGRESRDAAPGPAAKIGPVRHWPVTVSYFDPTATGDQTPEYTIAFQLWENGVSTDMTMDYGDFALAGRLMGYEALPEDKCD
ncbi:cell envelope integrity EipB family protein [Oharaeibacter diazotrophicus]|uniref:Uncharacterized protein DUF1849 n=1 Tax=Oharaeibacter diazotrophicus TaxID=1920512 RepID=A0A4R6RIY5_9HYPH|nr:cell envelope integrity EipB family protein [Oharaeibacter diazotrophicus]TDP86499.1 uncharacterized protein DUF1849 [Oharaeibacter diazotrophicus]BBE71559.1 hypothetical protein OHA_1_01135 [Pleomorphomonas sp. SM30]GLS78319.1 ATP-binding protein [Oharaeibacter diazotrophicus]